MLKMKKESIVIIIKVCFLRIEFVTLKKCILLLHKLFPTTHQKRQALQFMEISEQPQEISLAWLCPVCFVVTCLCPWRVDRP
jgi:hypothetical protein